MIKKLTGILLAVAFIAQSAQARTKDELYESTKSFAESMDVFKEAIDPSNMAAFQVLDTKVDTLLRTLVGAGYEGKAEKADPRYEAKFKELDAEFTQLKTSRPSSRTTSAQSSRSTSPTNSPEKATLIAEIAKLRTEIKKKWGSAGCPLVEGSLRVLEIRLGQATVMTKALFEDIADALSDARKNINNELICRD